MRRSTTGVYLDDGLHMRPRVSHRSPRQRHFIVRWDEARRRFICDCGHPSETATDHEWHALDVQRGAV